MAPKRNPVSEPAALTSDDPRRPFKAARLRKERERIPGFLARDPQFDDADFEEWENSVFSLLRELFGANEFIIRFRHIMFRPIHYYTGDRQEWYGDPPRVWRAGLQHADKLLGEALEEADLQIPAKGEHSNRTPPPNITVNVSNQNVFSPTVHVTVKQMLDRLDSLALTALEKELATEHVGELQSEIDGERRWPIIAKSLEAIKGLGKSVYKEIAVPLIVEFLKQESGLYPR